MRTGIALLLLAAAALAQDVQEMAESFLAQEQEAFGHYERKDFAKAVAAFEYQISIFPDNPSPYYNIACCYALEGDAERAGTWLTLSIERGFRDLAHLEQDTDFDRVRQSEDYIGCFLLLKQARRRDPDPVPLEISPASVPPAPSLPVAIEASRLQADAVRAMYVLHGEHRYRRLLFDVYDVRMAVLARYIIENGDALDAADAAAERVLTAALYLAEAEGSGEPDRPLREAGAACVLRTVEEFLRGYPGDPRLAGVLLARVMALEALGRDAEGIALLRTIRADHPGATLAVLTASEGLARVLRRRLMRLRLFCDGVGDLLDLDAAAKARVDMHEGLVAYVFVSAGDAACERLLKDLPGESARFLPVVVCVDREAAVAGAWLAEHGRSFPSIAHGAPAFERLWLPRVPTVVIARKDGAAVAVDPDAAEIARLSR